MGFNTTVFILNDMLNEIERDPERFVRDIKHNFLSGTDHALGQTTVMRTGHANEFRLYATQFNSIIELSPWSDRTRQIVGRGEHQRQVVLRDIEQAERQLRDLKRAIQRMEW